MGKAATSREIRKGKKLLLWKIAAGNVKRLWKLLGESEEF
jgi:hypothetical protein